MSVTIYHNPQCGTSRNTLELIRNTGQEPVIIHYLSNPPTRDVLVQLLAAMNISARELLRKKGTPFDDLNLADPTLSDDSLIDFMIQYPILINRPIVITDMGTKLCRPSELVLDILPLPQLHAFNKEDGEKVIDQEGHRVSR